MKAKTVIYERLFNTGNFSHEKFSIEIELEDGEKAQDAIDKARELVKRQFKRPTEQDREIAKMVSEFDEDDIPF
ncbi:MAG: hypothetical protein P8X74_03760 [Reinekea sp.]